MRIKILEHHRTFNLAIIDGGDLVEDPVAGLSFLLDLKFIDKLDRKNN